MQSSDRGGKPALSRRAFVGKLAADAAVASAVTLTIGQAQALSRGAKVPAGGAMAATSAIDVAGGATTTAVNAAGLVLRRRVPAVSGGPR
jgi:hypothetical protein